MHNWTHRPLVGRVIPEHSRRRAPDPPLHTFGVDDEQPPICPTCGVTMVPAALSARAGHTGDWVCLECEESGEPDPNEGSLDDSPLWRLSGKLAQGRLGHLSVGS